MQSAATGKHFVMFSLFNLFAILVIRATAISLDLTARRPQVNFNTSLSSPKYLVSVTNISGLVSFANKLATKIMRREEFLKTLMRKAVAHTRPSFAASRLS